MSMFGMGVIGIGSLLVFIALIMVKGKSRGGSFKIIITGVAVSGVLMVGCSAKDVITTTPKNTNAVSKEVPAPESSLMVNGKVIDVKTVKGVVSPAEAVSSANTSVKAPTTPAVAKTDSGTAPVATPATTKAPLEIVAHTLNAINHDTELAYQVKNNSNKVAYSYKIIIITFNAKNEPAIFRNDPVKGSSYPNVNYVQQSHKDYDLNPGATKSALGGLLASDKITTVKIIVTQVDFGSGDIWSNPDNDSIIQNHNKF